MQTKKILGIALVASIVASMGAVAATSAFAAEDASAHTFGVIGGFNEWGGDVAMTDEDGDGVYVGVVDVAGTYEFKVRADGAWDLSWGTYEADYDRTQNSQTNCNVTVAEGEKLVVMLDTTKVDDAAKANADSVVNEDGFDFAEDGVDFWPVTFYTFTPQTAVNSFGVIGGFNEWGGDVVMSDDNGDGVYEAVVKATGSFEFKVRADGAWDLSWGAYEENYDRTQNSQTNFSVEVPEGKDMLVKIDTTKVADEAVANAESAVNEDGFNFAEDGIEYWPVTYTFVDAKADEPSQTSEEPSQASEEPSQTSEEPSQVSTEEPSQVSEEPSKVEPATKTTTVTDYIYFDNSKTKWEKVYAYWWHSDYAKTVDLENNLYGAVEKTNEDGTTGYEPVAYPGTEMLQIEGTDIWQARIPFGAQKIIFNSGVSDAQVAEGVEAFQTDDLSFDAEANAGQIYTIVIEDETDVKSSFKKGRGVEKTKYKAKAGDWSAYTGKFTAETIESLVDPSELPSTPSNENSNKSSEDSTTPNTQVSNNGNAGTVTPNNNNSNSTNSNNNNSTNNAGNTGTTANGNSNAVSTGDVAMGVVFAAVAAAALGAAVIASKKKTAQD